MTSYEDFQFRTQRSWRFSASCTPPCQSGICSIFPFFWIDVYEWQHLVISKHIYHRHWNTFSVVFSNIFGKKRNIIVTFQSGQLTEQPKTLDDLGRFDLKMFCNCPIRIEIITGSHIFILFLPRVVTLCLHFTPCYR
jgi:hypothetical protein